ncbi:hypothetical protein NC652_000441 [Populus alba x Populus x berolinensis]|nr:hypothetical protein NC652_000441 [Populus alba x Populus x berolinensis]
MDGNNNVRRNSYRDPTLLIERGSLFFSQGYHADAANCFRHARDATIQIHGKSSLKCAITRYSHGLSLLCQVPVPVPENDPMAFLPKEVDYYKSSVLPFPSSAFGTYRGEMKEKYVRILEVAKGELNLAWSLIEYRIDNYLLKGNVLSALGEVAFRRGESNPQRYYFEASSIFDTWLGENNKRVADMYPLPGSDKSKALAHGSKAYLIYDALYKKLSSEIDSMTRLANQRTGLSSVTLTDPLIQLKNDEATQLRNYLQTMAIKASSYETHSLFVLLTRQERITLVTPAGRRCAKEKVEINTNLEL